MENSRVIPRFAYMPYLFIFTCLMLTTNSLKSCDFYDSSYNKTREKGIRIYDANVAVKEGDKSLFKINLCSVLNKTCTTDNIICQISLKDYKTQVSDGGNRLLIENVENCSMNIIFQCKYDAVASLEKYTGCRYRLLFPSANCVNKLAIPNIKFEIDANELYYMKPIKVSSGNVRKQLRICTCRDLLAALKTPLSDCGGEGDLAICEINDKDLIISSISMGMELSYTPYSGLNLHFKIGSLKTTIWFYCEPKPSLGFRRLHDKLIEIEYTTNKACFKFPIDIDCKVKDHKQYTYDLNPLKNKIGILFLPSSNSTIYISICKPISENISSNCSLTNTFGCLIKPNNQAKRLGSLMFPSRPKILDDVLHITYISGMYCKGGYRANITVEFECSFIDSEPELKLIVEDECSYVILWRTKHACPRALAVGEDCRVHDTFFTYYNFDLLPLHSKTKDYVIDTDNGEKFRINICGVLSTPCAGFRNASICFSPKNGLETAIAFENKTVLFEDGRLEFNFIGQSCREAHNEDSHVKLFLQCDEFENEMNIPEIFPYHDDKCIFHILWKTPLACPKPMIDKKSLKCSDQKFDLAQLSHYGENYEVSENTKKHNVTFVLNICKPVVFNYGYTCNDFPGACMINRSEPRIDRRFISIGKVVSEPFYNKTANVYQIRYTDDFCSHLSDSVITVIDIKCDVDNELPKLILKSFSDCNYHFVLYTSIVCEKERNVHVETSNNFNTCESDSVNKYFIENNINRTEKLVSDECLVTNIGHTKSFDLKSINGTETISDNDDSVLNLCAHNVAVLINNTRGYVDFLYVEKKSECIQCGHTTLLRIYCDLHVLERYPVIQKKTSCRTNWHWKTNKICPIFGIEIPKENLQLSSTKNDFVTNTISEKHTTNSVDIMANKQAIPTMTTIQYSETVTNSIISQFESSTADVTTAVQNIETILKNEKQNNSGDYTVATIITIITLISLLLLIFIYRNPIQKQIVSPIMRRLLRTSTTRSRNVEESYILNIHSSSDLD